MNEQGTVVSLSEKAATVRLKRSSACGDNCGNCGGCSNLRTVIADNAVNAKVGDLVEVSLPSKTVLSAAVIVYVIPLVVLIIGYFFAYVLLRSENAGVLFGICGMIISYIVISIWTSRNKNYCKSSITKIL